MVVVSDGGSYLDGNGSYELTAAGLPAQGRSLRIQRSGANGLKLCWPSVLTDYVLEANDRLDPIGWVEVDLPAVNNGLNQSLLVPKETGQRFYRLRQLD